MADFREIYRINRQIRDDKVIRLALSRLHAALAKRIFNEGKDANETLLPIYSAGYLKQRRRKQNRTNRRANLQYTGQMANDFSLIFQNNQYGSGFKNRANFKKSIWVEQTYNRKIFALSTREQKNIIRYFDAALRRL